LIMDMTWMFWLLALISGALIPVQAAANAALSKAINGNVPFVALTLFIVAGIATALGVSLAGAAIPTAAAFASAPWWSYIGGLIVAFYVFTITFLVPRVGVGTAVSLIVTGQVVAALIIDHFGLMRSLSFPVTPSRMLGATLISVGAFLALRR
jgi:bacterial/archaeal transporter family-2 protein